MSEPSKDNAHILENQQAFMAAVDRARERFGALEGVESVGFGQKQSGGEFTDDAAIVVFVREKKDAAELPPEERIPASFEGYRTDVRTLLRTVPGGCDNTSPYGTIQGGIQITVGDGTGAGTLGCIVRKRGDTGRENVHILSNRHVLFFGGARAGDYAYHPNIPGGSGASHALGPIDALAFYRDVQSAVPNTAGTGQVTDTFFIDCATARLNLDSECLGTKCTEDKTEYSTSVTDLQVNGVNTFSGVRSIARDPSIVVPHGGPAPATIPHVFKVGRTTGKTRGIVRSVGTTLSTFDPTLPGNPPVIGHNVIEIDFDPTSATGGVNCHGNPWFGERGDSGSIVVDDNGQVVGLLTGVPNPATPGVNGSSACHILPVLDKLGICIPTTGNSHGSCAATDGSGTAPAAAAGSGGTAGELRVAMAAPFPPPELAPVPVGAEQQARLFTLRDAFRESAKGRELHALFGMVRREVAYLVRNVRPVKVAWHRAEGPAYFAHVLNHLRGDADELPLRVNGVTRGALLERMAAVLAAYGSNPLRQAIERWRDELMPILSTAATVDECLDRFREAEEEAGAASNPAPDLLAAAAEGEAQ